MADAPMDDGEVELERRVAAELARQAAEEAELARRVGAARENLIAQLEGQWRDRLANVAPPPRHNANFARPARYDGRASSLNDWLFTFHLFLRATGMDPESEDAVVSAATYLDKDAISWWRHLSDRMDRLEEPRVNTWSAFSAAIKARFQVIDEDRHARNALTQLRQTTTVRAYLQEFQRLSLLAPGSNERDQVVRFTLGLRGDVRAEVDRGHPATILAAMTLADEAESRLHGYRPNPTPAWYQPKKSYNQGGDQHGAGYDVRCRWPCQARTWGEAPRTSRETKLPTGTPSIWASQREMLELQQAGTLVQRLQGAQAPSAAGECPSPGLMAPKPGRGRRGRPEKGEGGMKQSAQLRLKVLLCLTTRQQANVTTSQRDNGSTGWMEQTRMPLLTPKGLINPMV